MAELRFEEKLKMFKFLVSQEAKQLTSLAFDQSQILSKSRDVILVKEGPGSDPRGCLESKENGLKINGIYLYIHFVCFVPP